MGVCIYVNWIYINCLAMAWLMGETGVVVCWYRQTSSMILGEIKPVFHLKNRVCWRAAFSYSSSLPHCHKQLTFLPYKELVIFCTTSRFTGQTHDMEPVLNQFPSTHLCCWCQGREPGGVLENYTAHRTGFSWVTQQGKCHDLRVTQATETNKTVSKLT